MQYTGIKGTRYETIEPALGKGGEGSVYGIKNKSGSVLKVYQDKCRTETRHRKLLAMIATPLSQEAMNQVTWPTDVVYQNGQFAGYVMPEVKNNEALNVMYSDKYQCTFVQRSIIARNLCAAINSVHNAGQVCGDLNPNNIKVDPRIAHVTLIDTDSYHITDKKTQRTFRCEVGLPEYLPREVQAKMKSGTNLASAPLPTFTKETDLFALAVHIFALLMNGCHPFACAVNNKVNISLSSSQPSVACPQPIENICNGFFPFYTKKTGITIPRYAPDFDMLPYNIKSLFIKAFVNGHNDPSQRPNAVEWHNALEIMEKNVKTCGKNRNHLYPNHLNSCPWCELEQRMNPQAITSSVPKTNLSQTNTNINRNNTGSSNPNFSFSNTTSGTVANTKYGTGSSYKTNTSRTTTGQSIKNKLSFLSQYKGLIIGIIVVVSLIILIKGCIDSSSKKRKNTRNSNSQKTQSYQEEQTQYVNVTYDGYGSVTATPESGTKGTEITLTATPGYGYYLKEWQVISGGVTLSSNDKTTVTFILGDSNVEINAVFEEIVQATKGEIVTFGDFRYKITNNATDGTGTVALTGVANSMSTVSILNAVRIKGVLYKVTKISSRAFYNDVTVKTVTVGGNVVVIESDAFYGCSNLTKVSGGIRVKTIESNAFANCSRLNSFEIKSAVLAKIGAEAFSNDTDLAVITINKTTKLTKSGLKNSLAGSSINTVKVKKSKVKKYKKYFNKSNSGKSVKVQK